MKILAVNGSYREGGVTDQLIACMVELIKIKQVDIEVIQLRDYPIEFCLNCRECTQKPGTAPGACIQQDGMAALVDKIESADAYILASPTNFGSVSALFKRFMERLTVYAFWPWGAKIPKARQLKKATKKAVLLSSCAAPGIIGRLFFHTMSQLKMTAQVIGAGISGRLTIGLMANTEKQQLDEKTKSKAQRLVNNLLKSAT